MATNRTNRTNSCFERENVFSGYGPTFIFGGYPADREPDPGSCLPYLYFCAVSSAFLILYLLDFTAWLMMSIDHRGKVDLQKIW
jgi:hypothetical protein